MLYELSVVLITHRFCRLLVVFLVSNSEQDRTMNTDDSLTVLACQIHIPNTQSIEISNQHLRTTCGLVCAELEQQHSDLVLLPELSSIDYSRES